MKSGEASHPKNKGLNEEFYKQNKQVSFRFAEIASWRVRGSSFQF
jgi:hypothetical protein